MKQFCIKGFFFAFVISLIFILLDVGVTQGLKSDTRSNLGVWNAIYEGKINSDVIINGSSRAVYHIDPRIVSDTLDKTAYNMGMDGQMFEIQYCRFKVYLEHNPPPKVIIHSIDCHTLSKTEGIYDYQQFLPFLQDSIIKNTLITLEGLSKNDFVLPMARYAGEFKLIFYALKLRFGYGNNIPDRYNGFEGQNRTWNSDLETAGKQHADKRKIRIDKRVIRLFEEYIKYCKSHNIELILVYTPEYIEGQSFIKNRKSIIQFYEHVSAKYHIPFLNYSASKLSMNKNLFYNTLHLNAQGAEKFTYALSRDIKGLSKALVKNNNSYSFNMKAGFN